MPQQVLINVGIGEVRVAIVEDGKLQALSCTRRLGTDEANGSMGDDQTGASG